MSVKDINEKCKICHYMDIFNRCIRCIHFYVNGKDCTDLRDEFLLKGTKE